MYGKYRSSTCMLINSTVKPACRPGRAGQSDRQRPDQALGNLVVKNTPSFSLKSKVHLQQDHMMK